MERELLYLKIYNDLLAGIQSGIYPQGSRLPSEKELSEQYEVSRITSKKALEMLAEQNLIIRMPGKGSYVLEEDKAEDKTADDGLRPQGRSCCRRLIGMVVDQLWGSYSNQLISGVEYECRQRNFDLVLKCTYGSVEEETKALEDLTNLRVQGIILMCVQGENYNAKVLKLFVENFPIILVDREMPGLPIPCVSTDNYKASKELVEALIGKGHTDICFLTHQYGPNSAAAARFSGYLDGMLEHCLNTREELWIRDLDSRLPRFEDDEGDECADIARIRQLALEFPQVTGFFAVNLQVASMTYKALQELGLECEKEIICFDEFEDGSFSNSFFSHIVQGGFLMGARAVKLLQDRMKGKEVSQRNYIPYTLVERDN